MKQQELTKDMGDMCLWCRQSTVFGSGRFVNRIPAWTDTEEGYMCCDCEQEIEQEISQEDKPNATK